MAVDRNKGGDGGHTSPEPDTGAATGVAPHPSGGQAWLFEERAAGTTEFDRVPRQGGGIGARAPVPSGVPTRKSTATASSTQTTRTDPANTDAGHRQRLKQRFLETGPDGLPDYELLELALFNAIPRRDTKPLAKRLIAQFGSFAEAVSASEQRLREIPGIGNAVIVEFRLLQAAAQRIARSEIANRPSLGSGRAVVDYLRIAQGFAAQEQFRILFLDKRNALIADEVQGRGTVDHTPVYVREVVKRALELSATAMILVHNHPSGDPSPSKADVEMTRLIVQAARPFDIAVHDHIIVGRHGHASLKELRLM